MADTKGWSRVARACAVTLMSAVTLESVRGFSVESSLHLTKWYPVSGTAVTAVPLSPWFTVCGVVLEIDPCEPAA